MANKVRLLSVGQFRFADTADKDGSIERDAMLVYEGQFESADGPVDITGEHIDKLASTHNARLQGVLTEGEDLKKYPPVQLDHSTSSRDTVGRVIGPLKVGEYEGKKALYGRLRVLGNDNVERVQDGRWTHLSIGADLESGILNELSITPFPAAPNASMLSRVRLKKSTVKKESFLGTEYEILEELPADSAADGSADKQAYYTVAPLNAKFEDPTQAEAAIRKYIKRKQADAKATSLSAGGSNTEMPGHHVDEGLWKKAVDAAEQAGASDKYAFATWWYEKQGGKLSQGDSMDEKHEKLKKHLMEKEKLSEKDADEKLSKMTDDEKKELSAAVEKETLSATEQPDAGDKKEAEMAAIKKKASELTGKIKTGLGASRLSRKKVLLTAKLSGLVHKAKMTPAEAKKIRADLDGYAAKSDAELSAFFKGFELRENVIHVGMMGTTTKAESIARLTKKANMKALEDETRANMSSVPKKTNLSNAEDQPDHTEPTDGKGTAVMSEGEYPLHEHLMHLHEVHKHLSEGNHGEAMNKLVECMHKLVTHHLTSEGAVAPTEHELSAFTESAAQLEAQVEEVLNLVSPILGQ